MTGGLEALSRDEAKRAIAGAGGKATDSVSRKTGFVVAGVDPGTKLQRRSRSACRWSTRRPSSRSWTDAGRPPERAPAG